MYSTKTDISVKITVMPPDLAIGYYDEHPIMVVKVDFSGYGPYRYVIR